MQAIKPASAAVVRLSATERVYVGRAYGGCGSGSKLLNHLAGLRHDLGLYRLARSENYDFIQIRDKMFAGLVALLAAKSRALPFYYWMSFPYPEADVFRARDTMLCLSWGMRLFYRLRGWFTGWLLYKIVLAHADHIFVQSEQMKADVTAQGISPQRMTVVPMGINLDQMREAQNLQFADIRLQNRLSLVYVGTMVRVRRIDFLIDVLKRVRERVPEAMLVLVGDAPERDMLFLKSVAVHLGLADHVIFTGFLPVQSVWGYIKLAHVCLSPMRPSPILNSTTPTKMIEYLAMNKPVVANHHPDQSKVLDESGAGYAVEYEAQAFADAVIDLLRNPQKAAAMGGRGIDYVRRHRSYSALSPVLEAKYLELLHRSNLVKLTSAAL